MMSAIGTEVVLVDQLPESKPGQVSGGDLELVEREAQRIVVERNAFRTDQFRLAGNFRAHYLHTGPEFIKQSGGTVNALPSLPLLRTEHIDGYVKVTDTEAVEIARRLAREEGIFAGFSSGANVAVALHLLRTSFTGKTVAVILCDSGSKYLSTDLWV